MDRPRPTDSYTAETIQVLSGRDAVRRRPGMYIGSTDQRGLHHLIYEIVDNAVDEAMAGYCDRVVVTIREDLSVRVEDNGRGIPVETHPVTGKSALETVMTTLHAGGKFGGKSYQVSGGLHGVGASVVNFLSEWLVAEVRRDGRLYRQEYRRGVPQGPVEEVGPAEGTGTAITFRPDPEIFPRIEYDYEVLARRFREICYLNPGLWLTFRSEVHGEEKTFYFEGGIASLVVHLNRRRGEPLHPVFYTAQQVDSTQVEVALQYTDAEGELTLPFANCIPTPEGGTHLTGFRSALTRVLNDYIRRQKLVKEGHPNLAGEDVREGLTAVISVKLREPQFEGQTKTKLGNPEVKGQVESVVGEAFALWLEDHPAEARRIVERCLTAQRAREAARKARELVLRKNAMEGGSLPGKLADCSEKDPTLCELFIVEGESAGGSAKMGRDRRFQAVLPLRGKILNVEKALFPSGARTRDGHTPNGTNGPAFTMEKARLERLLSHEEIRALITAIGAGFGEDFDFRKLRYHRIIIMTDADVDGSHIRTLLLTFFFHNLRPLIWSEEPCPVCGRQGHLFIAQPPLYRIQAGKEVRYAYSEAEKEAVLKALEGRRGISIQRYKGLGEMNPEQLWETTMDPARRTLVQVQMEDVESARETFRDLMGTDPAPRRRFITRHALEVRNLDV